MIDRTFTNLKLYFKVHRLRIALLVATIVTVANMLYPLLDSEQYNFMDAFKSSVLNLVLYIIVTPILMVLYYFYKKQQIEKESALKEVPEIFNMDNYLTIFIIYTFFAFLLSILSDYLFQF